MLCFSSLSATYFSNGPFIIYSLRGWGSEGFFWGGWVRIWDLVFRGNGRGISRRQETINGGGGGEGGVGGGARRDGIGFLGGTGGGGGGGGGVGGGARRNWIWFLVGTAGRGISCRQGTLKEGL